MTDIRAISTCAAYDWEYCPRCGAKLELDQSPDDIVFDANSDIDVEASEANGFNFQDSVKHCGVHIRLWQAVDAYEESLS